MCERLPFSCLLNFIKEKTVLASLHILLINPQGRNSKYTIFQVRRQLLGSHFLVGGIDILQVTAQTRCRFLLSGTCLCSGTRGMCIPSLQEVSSQSPPPPSPRLFSLSLRGTAGQGSWADLMAHTSAGKAAGNLICPHV